MNANKLTLRIMIGMVLGILAGYAAHEWANSPGHAKEIASYFSILSDIFLRMIKMIIAPLVFSTVVSGIANMGDSKSVGRVGAKALLWFISASIVSLLLGCLLANVLQPGVGLGMALPDAHASTNLATKSLTVGNFLVNVFPKSIFEAFATNQILQILIFSIFFGLALASLPDAQTKTLKSMTDEAVHVMIKVTDFVMQFAPVGVFAAMSAAIATQGLGVLGTYGKLIGAFYAGLVILTFLLIFAGWLFLGRRVFTLMQMMRSVMLLAFSTASSEAAYPKTMEQLAKFGANNRITSFVLPLGYSFNLDGSMLYQSFAILFIAQAFGIDMPISQQLVMLAVLMVSSKGMAGVARASLVVVAAVLPMFNLPESGLLLIMAIDQFLDMGRTAINVVGNSIATAVVARWEGQLAESGEAIDADLGDASEGELIASAARA
ncbi:dicarboxylate/amino acid:cation symporter [Propionivibrio dicarboxylicus]|uniref:Na+/H+-dicarboxylate symporter n=1 Tax=Propionivibrio dicarboxylicus TaxID=83767 RepID=A0A1G8C2G8_9RHOO|nr:dicarboxylate/amino acid:cation symporter [Propionivibrio dicarboxylicus]SDH39534.1 Na+/H+-dicarboxylate symporter [Propionivibrio dicarboxylicus]